MRIISVRAQYLVLYIPQWQITNALFCPLDFSWKFKVFNKILRTRNTNTTLVSSDRCAPRNARAIHSLEHYIPMGKNSILFSNITINGRPNISSKENPKLKRTSKYLRPWKPPQRISRIIAKCPDNLRKSISDGAINAARGEVSLKTKQKKDIGGTKWTVDTKVRTGHEEATSCLVYNLQEAQWKSSKRTN